MNSITYTILTEESCENGDYEEQGWILDPKDNPTLRDCVKELFHTRTNEVDGYRAVYVDSTFSITVDNGNEFRTGACESRTLFMDGVTPASFKRLAKLLGAFS